MESQGECDPPAGLRSCVKITPDARRCRKWNVWDGRLRRCDVIYRKGDGWELDIPERFTRFVLRRAPADEPSR